MPPRPARIALVGDRSPHVLAHARIPEALRHATTEPGAVDPYWIASTEAAALPGLADFDGIWLVPGSPYADRDGVLHAARVARIRGVPLLGTCGGFQHTVLEFARTVPGLPLEHAESPLDPAAAAVIVPLTCSLVGEEAEVDVVAGTAAARILGAGRRAPGRAVLLQLRPAGAVPGTAGGGRPGVLRDRPDRRGADAGTARAPVLPGVAVPARALVGPDLGAPAHPGVRRGRGAARDRPFGVPRGTTVRGGRLIIVPSLR